MDSSFDNLQASYRLLGDTNIEYLCKTYLGNMSSSLSDLQQQTPCGVSPSSSGEPFRHKAIKKWRGEDCEAWALSVLYPYLECHEYSKLQSLREVKGQQLLNMTVPELSHFVGDKYAQFLLTEIQKLKANERADPRGMSCRSQRNLTEENIIEGSYMYDSLTSDVNVQGNIPPEEPWNHFLSDEEEFSAVGGDALEEPFLDTESWNEILEDLSSYDSPGGASFDEDQILQPAAGSSSIGVGGGGIHREFQDPAFLPYNTLQDPAPLPYNEFQDQAPVPYYQLQDQEIVEEEVQRNPPLRAQAAALPVFIPSGEMLGKIQATKRKRARGPWNWEFLMRLLADPRTNPSIIEWEDEATATFRLKQPEVIAKIWASRKEEPEDLTYNNFARGLRHHYKTGTLIPIPERQLVYRCGPRALAFLQSLGQSRK